MIERNIFFFLVLSSFFLFQIIRGKLHYVNCRIKLRERENLKRKKTKKEIYVLAEIRKKVNNVYQIE